MLKIKKLINLGSILCIVLAAYSLITRQSALCIQLLAIVGKGETIRSYMSLSVSVLSSIFGALVTVHLVSIQLVGRKPYSAFHYLSNRGSKIYVYISFIVSVFLLLLSYLFFDFILENRLYFIIDFIFFLIILAFLNLISILLFQFIIFNSKSFLNFILKDYTRIKIKRFNLLSISQKEGRYKIVLNLGGNGKFDEDVLQPFYQILLEAFQTKDKVLIIICIEGFLKHILKIHGVKYRKVLELDRKNKTSNDIEIQAFFFNIKDYCFFWANKIKGGSCVFKHSFFTYGYVWCKLCFKKIMSIINNIKSSYTYLLNKLFQIDNIYVLIAGLHFFVLRYSELMEKWDDEQHRKFILASLGNVVYTFSEFQGFDMQIKHTLYAMLSICLTDSRTDLWGVYEPMMDMLKQSEKLKVNYKSYYQELLSIVAYCELETPFFNRKGGIRPEKTSIKAHIIKDYNTVLQNTKNCIDSDMAFEQLFPDNIWNYYIKLKKNEKPKEGSQYDCH